MCHCAVQYCQKQLHIKVKCYSLKIDWQISTWKWMSMACATLQCNVAGRDFTTNVSEGSFRKTGRAYWEGSPEGRTSEKIKIYCYKGNIGVCQWLIAQLVECSLSAMKDPSSNFVEDICSFRYWSVILLIVKLTSINGRLIVYQLSINAGAHRSDDLNS
jgi:hypothetical protein